MTLEARFWDKVKKKRGCWEWTAGRHRNGHGHLWSKEGTLLAHRVSYEINVGRIPKGEIVRHKCDNAGCVNPKHLELGTQAENVQDMVDRGRGLPYGRQGKNR